jgi:hypothetical protein
VTEATRAKLHANAVAEWAGELAELANRMQTLSLTPEWTDEQEAEWERLVHSRRRTLGKLTGRFA